MALQRVRCAKCSEEFHPNFRICPRCGTYLAATSGNVMAGSQTASPASGVHSSARSGRVAMNKPSPEQPSNPSKWADAPPAPWRRFAARSLDLTVNGVVMVLVIAIVFFMLAPYQADQFFGMFETPGGVFLDLLYTSLAGSVLTGLIIGLTGSSLGKLIFGVKVMKLDGSLLGPMDGISRDVTVWVKGLGLGVPIIALFTQVVAYQRLKGKGSTSWDEGMYRVTYRENGPMQYALNVLGVVLIVLVGAVSRVILQV